MPKPTKLQDLRVEEVSGVDDPANEIPGFMVMKQAEAGESSDLILVASAGLTIFKDGQQIASGRSVPSPRRAVDDDVWAAAFRLRDLGCSVYDSDSQKYLVEPAPEQRAKQHEEKRGTGGRVVVNRDALDRLVEFRTRVGEIVLAAETEKSSAFPASAPTASAPTPSPPSAPPVPAPAPFPSSSSTKKKEVEVILSRAASGSLEAANFLRKSIGDDDDKFVEVVRAQRQEIAQRQADTKLAARSLDDSDREVLDAWRACQGLVKRALWESVSRKREPILKGWRHSGAPLPPPRTR